MLQSKFQLPRNMYFYYIQLRHVIKAKNGSEPWVLSPTPIFNYMSEVEVYKGFISQSYYMLLLIFLRDFPSKAEARWKRDVEAFEE